MTQKMSYYHQEAEGHIISILDMEYFILQGKGSVVIQCHERYFLEKYFRQFFFSGINGLKYVVFILFGVDN